MNTQMIKQVLNGKSVTMAQIRTETRVKPAAKFKDVVIQKNTSANVQLFSNIQSAVYANAVKRSSGAENFEQSETYYSHDPECYSVVTHKGNGKEYMYCIYNNAKYDFLINGAPASQEDVIAYLTPSEAKKQFGDNSKIVNKTNDVEHDVIVRVIDINNIREIRACGQVIN